MIGSFVRSVNYTYDEKEASLGIVLKKKYDSYVVYWFYPHDLGASDFTSHHKDIILRVVRNYDDWVSNNDRKDR